MDILPTITCTAAGFLVGTWLHVVVFRTPIHERMMTVPLHCTNCGVTLHGRQKIPFLAGLSRCTTCERRVWPPVPWLECATALSWGVLGARFGWAWALPAYLVFFAALVAITVVDIRHYIIPNRVVFPALFAGLGLLALAAIAEQEPEAFLQALVGMAGAWLFFFVVWLTYPRGMGFGDVRLSALVGLMTGWIGLGNVVLGLFIGILAGAVAGVVFVMLRFLTHRDPIPYGPFLAFGGVTSVLWGSDISQWWTTMG